MECFGLNMGFCPFGPAAKSILFVDLGSLSSREEMNDSSA